MCKKKKGDGSPPGLMPRLLLNPLRTLLVSICCPRDCASCQRHCKTLVAMSIASRILTDLKVQRCEGNKLMLSNAARSTSHALMINV